MAQPKKDVQEIFLQALLEGLPITKAAEQAAIPRRTLYNWRGEDEVFRAAWEEAYEQGTDALEAEAQRRAVDGVEDVKMVGYGENAELVQIRKYSDTLLIFLLKARRPAKFRDNFKVEVTGKNDGPIEVEHKGVSLSDVLRVARQTGAASDPGGDS